MSTFTELALRQEETGQEILKLIRNFKKDGADRKTSVEYFIERQRRLEQLWSQFETIDTQMRVCEDLELSHAYFKNDYWSEIQALTQQYQDLFSGEMAKLRPTAPPRTDGSATSKRDRIVYAPPSDGELIQGIREPHSDVVPIQGTLTTKDGLLRKLGTKIASMHRLLLTSASFDNQPRQVFELKINLIMQLWRQIEDINDLIWEQYEDPATVGHDLQGYIELEERVHNLVANLTAKLGDIHQEVEPRTRTLQLPKVIIPKFDGTYAKWPQFFDLFTQMVDTQSLPKVQKMWYLKTNVVGEAEQLIRHFTISEDNYSSAWETLRNRYNNKRLLASTLIEKIMEQPSKLNASSTALKSLHDTTQECLMALENVGIDTATWDPMLLFVLVKKLDKQTRLMYEQSITNPSELQPLKTFLSFLRVHFQSLETMEEPTPTKWTANRGDNGREIGRRSCALAMSQQAKERCALCKGGIHQLYQCNQFLHQSPTDRSKSVLKVKLCYNCLKPGHFANKCMARTCTKCEKRHNSLLHSDERLPTATTVATALRSQEQAVTIAASHASKRQHVVLLSTAIVTLVANNGQQIDCRALLDSGSQVNLISRKVINQLNICPKLSCTKIFGIDNGVREANQRVNVLLRSRVNNFKTRFEALVLPQIITDQPSQPINVTSWQIPNEVSLADPTFHVPASIDLLIGAEFFHQILTPGQIHLADNLPILQNSVFGWVLSGRIGNTQVMAEPFTCGVCTHDDTDLDIMVERLWKLDEIECKGKILSPIDQSCENQFVQNIRRTTEGRYMVRLPFYDDTSRLGASSELAMNRFLALERKLMKDPELRQQYVAFMDEYEALGHMARINMEKVITPNYIIPHHCVLKPDSSSTKLRVVFDASAKTSSGLSLNDTMYTGPRVQDDLFSILLRFRLPRFVFCTDIQKMYRQIVVNPDDRRYQLIFWRRDPREPVHVYQLNTVTYGTKSAPYLATRCLQQAAIDHREEFPLGAEILQRNFYVDDCLTGSDSLTTTLEMQRQLIRLLKSAGFELRKWCANHPRLLQGIKREHQEIDLDFDMGTTQSIKTLGLRWLPKDDNFCVKTTVDSVQDITKRAIMSDLAKLFDPLGLLAPILVTAKIFVQRLWQLGVKWDETLPSALQKEWIAYRNQLITLNNFCFPRHLFNKERPNKVQIHTFCDASEKAYGAAIYVRSSLEDGRVIVRLLCSKSRIAPLKKQTLPRLELCAALLGAELSNKVKLELQLKNSPFFLWTDSQIVLSWINAASSSFHTFVANRVAGIQQYSSPEQWRHVPSKDNPADLISRGIRPDKLPEQHLWLYGPFFLHGREDTWPARIDKELLINHQTTEIKKVALVAATGAVSETLIYTIPHHNSFKKLQRVVGYVLRFVNYTRIPRNDRPRSRTLTCAELSDALYTIIRAMQGSDFKEEISDLRANRNIKKESPLLSLTPFLDETGVVRVGGRLPASSLPFDAKHPMLLPYNDPLTKLILLELHRSHKHCGPQTLLAHARQQFWPIKGKTMVRSIVQNCVRCRRARPTLLNQVMGNLPKNRVTSARPFINSGVDYCGPVWIHYNTRGKRPQKAYIAIFCCFATKAVHVELVSNLTTDAFIGALKKIIGRRGHCKNIYCDNATNFVGANNKLSELTESVYSDGGKEKITEICNQRAIQFNFIPPRSPHFGGLWEAAVKSAKQLLLKSVSTESLTYEELETVLIEIEAILNSRPLTPISDNPNDLTALTPGHFLIGEPLTAKIDQRATEEKRTLLSRWRLVSHLKHEFWNRWSREYLHELQHRKKWKQQSPNIHLEELVVIKEDNLPPLSWPLGRIEKLYYGDDGAVRVADVRTASGICKRPIHRLAPLPVQSESIEPTGEQDCN